MKLIKQGWVCPKCGRVYAPWITQCTECGNTSIGYGYTVGIETTLKQSKESEDQND